jgi:hypothetical protein
MTLIDQRNGDVGQSEGNGSGTQDVYFVEARSVVGPQNFGGMLLTDKWQRVQFHVGTLGVHSGVHPGPTLNPQAIEHGFVDDEAAEALAAWFRAGLAERGFRGIGIETRIVAVKFTYSYTAERVHNGPTVSALTASKDFRCPRN